MRYRRIFGMMFSLFLMMTMTAFAQNSGAAPTLPVAINKDTFPHDGFREYVSKQYDKNRDGILSLEEANAVTELMVYQKQFSDLRGIEYFKNLESLDCSYNGLSELDLSHNPALRELNCSYNPINTLDLTHNPVLKELLCGHSPLEQLDLRNNLALEYLYCNQACLAWLNLERNTALKTVGAWEQFGPQMRAYRLANGSYGIHLDELLGAGNVGRFSLVSGNVKVVGRDLVLTDTSYPVRVEYRYALGTMSNADIDASMKVTFSIEGPLVEQTAGTEKILGLKKKVTLYEGKKQQLSPVIIPSFSQDKITYRSSNSKIASVGKNGEIKAKKAGTTKITVRSGKCRKTVQVTVKKAKSQELSLNKKTLTLKKGGTAVLKASRKGKIRWSSSRHAVATVSKKGKVTAKKTGKTVITAKLGKMTAKCTVTVKEAAAPGTSSVQQTPYSEKGKEALEAYRRILREGEYVFTWLDDSSVIWGYHVLDIDQDGVPELMLVGDTGSFVYDIYKYDQEVKRLGSYSINNIYQYYPKAKIFSAGFQRWGRYGTSYMKLQDGKLQTIASDSNGAVPGTLEGNESHYYMEGQEVSEKKYVNYIKKLLGNEQPQDIGFQNPSVAILL